MLVKSPALRVQLMLFPIFVAVPTVEPALVSVQLFTPLPRFHVEDALAAWLNAIQATIGSSTLRKLRENALDIEFSLSHNQYCFEPSNI